VRASPLSQAIAPPASSHRHAAMQHRPSMPSPPGSALIQSHSASAAPSSASPVERPSPARVSTTPGMDTLADLAVMQHHQHTARASAGGLRITRSYDTQLSQANIRPSLANLPKAHSGSRGSVEFAIIDSSPKAKPPPRLFFSASLTPIDLTDISQLFEYLSDNPHNYESHLRLIRLLRKGLRDYSLSTPVNETPRDPRKYELIQELHQANEAMAARFALGEDLWMERLQDEQMLAYSVEECLSVMELCQQAVSEEPGSTLLWALYGEWMTIIYQVSRLEETGVEIPQAFHDRCSVWSNEDKTVAREVFQRQQVLETWRQGTIETMLNINDSHLVWDRYMAMTVEDLARNPTQAGVASIQEQFQQRLKTPHATWDQTFSQFSTFISAFDPGDYEAIMVRLNQQCAPAKAKYAARETFEIKLHSARNADDKAAEWVLLQEYLEWETSQSRKKKYFSFELTNALLIRSLLRFPTATTMWEEYLAFLTQEVSAQQITGFLLKAHHRATAHCPWSGTLWGHYIRAAEREKQSFTEISEIKHKATRKGLLDASTLDEVLSIHVAWCGYLRRCAFEPGMANSDIDIDVAEMGIRSALEDMENLGRQRHGDEYQGDPRYRLERIYIRFLTQSDNYVAAREMWQELLVRHGNDYEFWQRRHIWEMMVWGMVPHKSALKSVPREATKVLMDAIKMPQLDWPEKLIDNLVNHCEDYEEAEEQQAALFQARKARQAIEKRRAEEQVTAQAPVEQQYAYETPQIARPAEQYEAAGVNGKRKRTDEPELSSDQSSIKRSRQESLATETATQSSSAVSAPLAPPASDAPASLKRDRENATVVVKNLPSTATEKRIRHFFRDCGTINKVQLAVDPSGSSATAAIEFDNRDDVLVAQTRDMKTFEDHVIEVQVGGGMTVYVANFPSTADEAYIRHLFDPFGEVTDVRFPSLKYNTHRRFCYVQFRNSAEAQAATELDGRLLDPDDDGKERLKLIAKISDPTQKQKRSGALEEGREVYVSNVDWNVSEDELSTVFSKYGAVETVRVPRNFAGKSKGMAFVVFKSAEHAKACLELDATKLKSRILNVSVASSKHSKRSATTLLGGPRSAASASPAPESGGAGANAHSPSPSLQGGDTFTPLPSREEISSRTIALMNVPDTVNDARMRALVEPHGSLNKIILRPHHQGAIIEFQDVASVGKAGLALEGYEIVPGRRLAVGSVAEMMASRAERRDDRIEGAGANKGKKQPEDAAKSASLVMGGGVVRRPGQQSGRMGGLGVKRGGGGLGGARAVNGENSREKTASVNGDVAVEGRENGEDGVGEEKPAAKSNADFKNMFLTKR